MMRDGKSMLMRMLSRFSSKTHWLMPVAFVAAFHLPVASVFAQREGKISGEEGTLLEWGIGAGIVVICVLTGFINPKRTHQT
ncbi:MAG: hypothetical protein JSV78_08515 [Phycisphaerales bacterium]|nr:MAG: hypothetical protein JSV78_08515 [Phycisphaerales bacterium]